MDKKRCTLAVIAAGFLWGFSGVFSRFLSGFGFNSSELLIVEYGVAAAIFAVHMLLRDRPQFRVAPRHIWRFALLGVGGMMLMTYFFFRAMQYTTVGLATVLEYTGPIWCVLVSALVFREKITVQKLLSLLLMVGGSVLVSGLGKGELITPLGFLLGVLSGVFGGMYSIFMRMCHDKGYKTLTVSFYGVLFAALGAAVMFGAGNVFVLMFSSWKAFLLCLAFGGVCCYLPTMLFSYSLQGIGPGTASVLSSSTPVIAVILGMIFFHEKLTVLSAGGIVLVMAGLIVMNIEPKKAAADKALDS